MTLLRRKPTVTVLGATGMLGHAVYDVLKHSDNYSLVIGTSRDGSCDARFDVMTSTVGSLHVTDYVVNCIGCIPQRYSTIEESLRVNALFPLELTRWWRYNGCKVIHVSTDCVFSGKDGSYTESHVHDCSPEYVYGTTKSLGEPESAMVLRTSIVGFEQCDRTSRSLLEWAVSQRGKRIEGYVDHLWNGVTNVQLAQSIDKVITDDLWASDVFHVFGETLSKCDMLRIFSEELGLGLDVVPVGSEPVDRTLSTTQKLNSELNIPSFRSMIDQIKIRKK